MRKRSNDNQVMKGLSGNEELSTTEDYLRREMRLKGFLEEEYTIPNPYQFDALIYTGDKYSIHYNGDFYMTGDKEEIQKFYCGVRMNFGSNNKITIPVLKMFYNSEHLCLINCPQRDFDDIIPFDNIVKGYDDRIKRLKDYADGIDDNPNDFDLDFYISNLKYINDLDALRAIKKIRPVNSVIEKVDKRINQPCTAKMEVEAYRKRVEKFKKIPAIEVSDFAAIDDKLRPVMGCMVYRNGYMVASDTHHLIKYKADYPKELEETLVPCPQYVKKFPEYAPEKGGVEGKYPNYETVIPSYTSMCSVDVDLNKLYSFLMQVDAYRKDYGIKEDLPIHFFADDKFIGAFRPYNLTIAVRGAKLINADRMYFTDFSRAFLFRNSKDDETGSVILQMPCLPNDTLYKYNGQRAMIDYDNVLFFKSFDFGKITEPYQNDKSVRGLNSKVYLLEIRNQVLRSDMEYAKYKSVTAGLGGLWGDITDEDLKVDDKTWEHFSDVSDFALQLLNEVESVLDNELRGDTVVVSGVDKRRKIDDYGEKIFGARKDMLKEIAKSYDSLTKQVIISKTFSKVFKQPDVKTLCDSGVIRNSDAQFIYAICQTLQAKPRGSSWRQERQLEAWAERTMNRILLIKSILLATSDEERDNIIKSANTTTEEEKALRIAIIEKLRKLNSHLSEKDMNFGAVEQIKELKIINDVLTEVNYHVGDTTEIPIKAIYPDQCFQEYELIDANNTRVQSAYSEKDAIDKIVAATFIANPYEGMQIPIKQYKICPDRDSVIKKKTDKFSYITVNTPKNAEIQDRIYSHDEIWNVFSTWGRWLHNKEGKGEMTDEEAIESFEEHKKYFPKKNQILCRYSQVEETVGYTKYQIGINDSKGVYKHITIDADSKDNALAALELNYDDFNAQVVALLMEGKTRVKTATIEDRFEIIRWSWRKDKSSKPISVCYKPFIFKGNTSGAKVVDCETEADAKAWIKNYGKQYVEMIEERKKLEQPFFDKQRKRVGPDYRQGKDIDEKIFAEKFGFRGVQFGNWTNDNDRQAAVNNCYDALLDMCEILNLNPRGISLNGTLGIAFGARGTGKANAHYESLETVINLTKTRGAGSLAHEWWHALDNHWSTTHHLFLTSDYIDGVRDVVATAYKLVSKAITDSSYGKRCMKISGSYWGSMIEMTARLFQLYIDFKLREKENTSPFLERGMYIEYEDRILNHNYRTYKKVQETAQNTDIMSIDDFRTQETAYDGFVYPTQEELKGFVPLIDNIFSTIKQTITDNGNVILSGNRR